MDKNFWQITDEKNNFSSLITLDQTIVGSSPHCDIVIDDKLFSSVLFLLKKSGTDLFIKNISKTPIYVNDALLTEIKLQNKDVIKIGNRKFGVTTLTTVEYKPDSVINRKTISRYFHYLSNKNLIENKPDETRPLTELNPDAIYSNVLLEKNDHIYPIFTQKKNQRTLEVAIVLQNTLLNVYQLKTEFLDYFFTGKKSFSPNFVNLPFLKESESFAFAKKKSKDLELLSVPGTILTISDQSKNLNNNISIYSHGDFQVFVRYVPSEKEILPPPFFGRDKRYPLIFVPLLILGIIFQLFIFSIKINKDEIVKKAPERIAKILYRPKEVQQVSMSPTPDKKQASPPKVVEEVKPIKAPDVPQPPKKSMKVVTNNITPKPIPKPVRPKLSSKFSSLFSSKIAQNARNAAESDENDTTAVSMGGASAGVDTGKLKEVKVIQGDGKGVQYSKEYSAGGLTGDKKGLDFDSVSYKTVILGSIDPLIVKKIILENIPDMTFCYEQGLSTHSKDDIPSSAFIEFTIGATGHVISANVKYKDKTLPPKSHQCLITTIKQMKFPAPKGGGFVNVRQPINFTH